MNGISQLIVANSQPICILFEFVCCSLLFSERLYKKLEDWDAVTAGKMNIIGYWPNVIRSWVVSPIRTSYLYARHIIFDLSLTCPTVCQK
jgi:hypothetical protein